MIEINDTKLVDPKVHSKIEETEEKSIRPKNLDEFVGQSKMKNNLLVFIEAAKKRGDALEHTLFYGPPGLGKTTLSMIIAKEMDKKLYQTSGPAIEKQGDLASLLTNLEEGDILFIDEIHRLKSSIEEILYSALEDFYIDIMIGNGPTARSMRIDLPKFTLIGATTKASMVSAPLRDRLGQIFRLNFYSENELEQIISRSAKILKIETEPLGLKKISECSRFTPRIANRLLRRVRDFAQIKFEGKVTEEVAKKALKLMDIDEKGLDEIDRALLSTIIEKYNGGPVGLNTLSASISEEANTIEEMYEPFLLKLGFLSRTPRGRTATDLAYQHLGINRNTDKILL